ncbi:hypothetical protein CANCADRAFT_95541 [Tortispora caseinolytica NRRL Y-17796]|uniref:Uncharacterized protein n=1 Tax=Tortispora caseinolytica NRRL Y-17796 TaxID=767744 RepID=A0A1E4TMR9_9ASCO|nr:hypothetical protein CANCADRAFT_95541 [Tortispora caseinolytica NRRL Y-17796]
MASFRIRHVSAICLLAALLTTCLVTVGCLSSSTASLYLYSLEYCDEGTADVYPDQKVTNIDAGSQFRSTFSGSSLVVRAGYFGTCIKSQSSVWSCSTDLHSLQEVAKNIEGDPANILNAVELARNGMLLGPALIAAACLSFAAMILLIPRMPSAVWRGVATSLALVATMLVIIVAIAQNAVSYTVVNTARGISNGGICAYTGSVAMGLAWFAIGATALATVGIYIIHTAINALSKEASSDDASSSHSKPYIQGSH